MLLLLSNPALVLHNHDQCGAIFDLFHSGPSTPIPTPLAPLPYMPPRNINYSWHSLAVEHHPAPPIASSYQQPTSPQPLAQVHVAFSPHPLKTAPTHHCIRILLRQPPSYHSAVNYPESLQEYQIVDQNRDDKPSSAFHPRHLARVLGVCGCGFQTQMTRTVASDA